MNHKKGRVRKDFLQAMFKENTGIAMMDSGGENGRAWQRNQTRDFEKEPEYRVTLEQYGEQVEVNIRVSLYHHLKKVLKEDSLCRTFNRKFKTMKDWDCDGAYGVSEAAGEWLENRGITFGDSGNSYNWENNFDGIVQYTKLEGELPSAKGDCQYILVQLHGGADVRGGYTDAKLFYIDNSYDELFMIEPWVSFTVERNGERFNVDAIPGDYMCIDGEHNNRYEPMIGDKIVED